MVPERGLHAFAVGIDIPMGEINRMLTMVSENEGGSKFLRGGYGCGKTFISQLTMIEALNRNYAVSKVVVSPNDTHFHKFDEVYARIVGNLQTSLAKGGGSLGDCIDRWIAKIEDRLISEGQDEDGHDFDNLVKQRFDQELADIFVLSRRGISHPPCSSWPGFPAVKILPQPLKSPPVSRAKFQALPR